MEQNNKNTRFDPIEKYTRTRITRSLRRRRSLHRKSDNFFSWPLHVVFEPERYEDEPSERESETSRFTFLAGTGESERIGTSSSSLSWKEKGWGDRSQAIEVDLLESIWDV